ncbi:MAG TPA: multicopper oxidase domain-containing protein, partial [Geobacteraceae bacterium]
GVVIDKVRQVTLKENEGAGGPETVFVNNTNWDGLMSPNIASIFPTDGVSELPRVGAVELWEIINLTVDTHPMHTHLAQFQILNRQNFNPQYITDWEAAFPGDTTFSPLCTPGVFCPGYGPPMAYNVPNADGALGGNLPLVNGAVNYLNDPLTGLPYPVVAPDPEESGWKDTGKAYPGKVTRILVRWTPTSTPTFFAEPGRNLYPFDPTTGPGYVWHCHIIDHEDNEMMRPYKVTN